MRTTSWLLAICLGSSAWLAGPPASAEEDGALQQAKQYYQQGLAAYQQGRYDDAIRALRRAQLLRPSPGLLLNLGRTYRAAGQGDQALSYFEKYLKEAPEGDKERRTAEKAIAEIRAEQAAAQKGKGEVAPKLLFVHHPVDALPTGEPPRLWAYLVAPKGAVARVYYRRAGQSAFETAPMKPQDGEDSPALMAELPPAVGKARRLQYYVEVRDGSGALLRSSGSALSPHLVILDPLARGRGQRPSWNLDDK